MVPGSVRTNARAGARWASRVVTMARQAAARSKPSGRCTGSPVGSTDRTRLTRKVRCPASVQAIRYQTWFLTTRPKGCTTRSDTAPSRRV